MADADLFAVTAGPAGASDPAVGGGEDRRAVAGAEIHALVHSRIAKDRMAAHSEIGRNRCLARAVAALRSVCRRPTLRTIARRPPWRPLHHAESLAAGAFEPGKKQPAGFGLAGCGAAMLDDDVEPVAGIEAADIHLRRDCAQIMPDRSGRGASCPRRAVEAGSDQALDPQRRFIDRDRNRH